LLFKERRPFKFKKECPSEQWQIISFRLIPLKTPAPVSFRWTVPLSRENYKKIIIISCTVALLLCASWKKGWEAPEHVQEKNFIRVHIFTGDIVFGQFFFPSSQIFLVSFGRKVCPWIDNIDL
jgi:hypothetical protein